MLTTSQAIVIVPRKALLIHNTAHKVYYQREVQGNSRRASLPELVPVGRVPKGGSPECFQGPCTGEHQPDAVQWNGIAGVDKVEEKKTST